MKTRSARLGSILEAGPSAKKALDMLENEEFDKFLAWLKTANEKDVEALFKTKGGYRNAVCPSGWSDSGLPYPGKLAMALVASKDQESLTDLCNPYYHGGNRKNSPEATQIFMDSVLKMPMSDLMFQLGDVDGSGDLADALESYGCTNGLDVMAEKDSASFKKILMRLPKDAQNSLTAYLEKLKTQGRRR